MKTNLVAFSVVLVLLACSPAKKIAKSAKQVVINDSALHNAHVGISIYEPATGKYLYNYQGDRYFVPASNTKIPTCYAAMKYLGDSLVGLRYGIPEEKLWKDKTVAIEFTGDPTFLHEGFSKQIVFDSLRAQLIERNKRLGILFKEHRFEKWGSGWSWNDYQEYYMAERNIFPVHGNVVHITLNDTSELYHIDSVSIPGRRRKVVAKTFRIYPRYFDSLVSPNSNLELLTSSQPGLQIQRNLEKNVFRSSQSASAFRSTDIPFVTNNFNTGIEILSDTLGKKIKWDGVWHGERDEYVWDIPNGDVLILHIKNWTKIYSQPTDSLLKPMMHRSDNFFAEQSLLMVSNERLGVMNDAKIIDTILKTDFKDLPQKPRWADGSGLSRYNLFTPMDMVAILNKMQSEFGMERIKEIFPTGGEGTLRNYYSSIQGHLFAKTGTLSGVVALSGFLYTKKNKLLIFSVLVNNHHSSATEVRRAVEKFLIDLRSNN